MAMRKTIILLICLSFVTQLSSAITRPSWLQLQDKPAADIRDYGAVGDGVTDDTAAFTSALAANSSIYLPNGEWVASGVVIPDTGMTIVGTGKDAIIVVPDGSPAGFIREETPMTQATFLSTYNNPFYFEPWQIAFVRFKIEGDYGIVDLLPFYGDGNRNSKLANCYFSMATDTTALKTRASWGIDIADCTFDGYWEAIDSGSYASNTTALEFQALADPILNLGTMAGRIHDCLFTTLTTPFAWSGDYTTSTHYAEGLYFVDNTFLNCRGVAWKRTNSLNILGNHFATTGADGLIITDCGNMIFSNNWVQSPALPDEGTMLTLVASDSEVVRSTISDNIFLVTWEDTDYTGIHLDRQANGFTGVIISDNQFQGTYEGSPPATISRFLLATTDTYEHMENILVSNNSIWQAMRCFQFSTGRNVKLLGNQIRFSNIILSVTTPIRNLDAPGILETRNISMSAATLNSSDTAVVYSHDIFMSEPPHGPLEASLASYSYVSGSSNASITSEVITDAIGKEHLRLYLWQQTPINAVGKQILASVTVTLSAPTHNDDNDYQ